MARLKVNLIKPQGFIVVKRGQIFEVEVDVGAQEVKKGKAEITFDVDYLKLVDSVKNISLEEGSWRRNVTWNLQALMQTDKTAVVIKVSTGLVQAAVFNVVIE